jgi:hypothetical protein
MGARAEQAHRGHDFAANGFPLAFSCSRAVDSNVEHNLSGRTPVEATLANGVELRSASRRFHLWMAAMFVLIAFSGFTPTYWARLANGTSHVPPIVHIHGILMFSWTLFYFIQTAWIAAGRTATHRAWGLAGISLFSVLVCSIIVTKVVTLRLDDAAGFGDAGRRFSLVALGSLPLIIGLFVAAIANVRRPEIHKRLMFVLMSGLMIPAIARVFLTLFARPGAVAGGPPPAFVAVPPCLVAILLIVVAMIYDWRTRRRPHKVYVYGAVLTVLNFVLIVPLSNTQAWMSVARFVESLGG